ncbi:MAG: serpin family protein [Chlamydiales bacterium]|nr:serpin family protein [Chlamydiales bacterium]
MLLSRILFCFIAFTVPLAAASKKDDETAIKLSKNCTDFGLSLYSTLNKSASTNIIFSPYSIFSCLSMVYIGARDVTATEMQTALKLTFKRPELSKAALALSSSLASSGDGSYTFDMANGLWLDRDSFVLSDYRHAIEDGFQAKVQSLDFAQTEQAISIINEWTSNQTHGEIPKLLEEGDIDGSTRVVLTNALYFKGNWQKPFDPKNTADSSFYLAEGSSVKTKMMKQNSTLPYFENESFQLLALPFVKKEGAAAPACLILLPKKGVALSDCEQDLTSDALRGWIEGLKPQNLQIKLPKFTLDRRYDLNNMLKALGIQNAFTDAADFSGIDGMRDLFLSKVVHESFFALDEMGVTAAAATSASMNLTATPPSQPPVAFVADRPFLFLLVDLKTKLPLFLGKLQDPSIGQSE